MSFLLICALNSIWFYRKVYCYIILELSLGFTMILCIISNLDSQSGRLQNLQGQFSKTGVTINAYTNETENVSEEIGITPQDCAYIKNHYNIQEIFYIAYGGIYTDNLQSIPVLCMSEEMFKRIFGCDMENRVYAGSIAKRMLEGKRVGLQDRSIWLEKDYLVISEERYFLTELTKKQENTKIMSFMPLEEYDYQAENCIFVPETLYLPLSGGSLFFNSSCELIFQNQDIKKKQDISSQVIDYLSGGHSAYYYELDNKIEEYLKNSKNIRNTIQILFWISIFLVLQVMIALVGVFIILLEQRKKELAIKSVVGASSKRVFCELFTEIILLCLISAIAGVFFSEIIILCLKNMGSQVRISARGILLLGEMGISISFFTVIFAQLCCKMKSVSEELKTE